MDTRKALNQLEALKKYTNQNIKLAAENWNEPWKTLMVTILSARTRDEITIPVAINLFKKYPNVEKLASTKIKEVQETIRPVNFYKNKSKNIIECAKHLLKDYNCIPPKDFEKLMKLPGVGRKTANVFLAEIGKNAIGVDTHLSYVSRKLGWSGHMSPHKIEKDLQKLFPKRYWNRINPIAVRFGKTYTKCKEKDRLLEEIKKINQ